MFESIDRAPSKRRVRLGKILPKFEGETVSTSIRMPKGMQDELKSISALSGHPVSDVIIYFMRWAIQEWHAERQEEIEAKKSKK